MPRLAEASSRASTIRQSSLGGGGYITGLVQHPRDPHTLYARCDVAGVFRSADGAKSWQALNAGMTEAHHHMVAGLAISPHHPDTLYRCSGDARGSGTFGSIHKSIDGGASWREVCKRVDFFGNGPSRMHAEPVACDPYQAGVVVAGGYSAGLWRSEDGGECWQLTGLKGERICLVAFHPTAPGRLYVASISDAVLTLKEQGARWAHETPQEKLARFRDKARGDSGRLYRSSDGGLSWELFSEGPDLVDLAFDAADPERLLAATLRHGVLKSSDGGRSWQERMTGLPRGMMYSSVAASPAAPHVLYVAPDARPQHEGLPPVPLYRSTDGGENWQPVAWHEEGDLRNYPNHMSLRHAGWAVSTVLVDHHDPRRLYLANWFGVAVSEDGGHSWDANGFSGIETTCLESVISDPKEACTVYATLADHFPIVSRDGGRSYKKLPLKREGGIPASDSTALVASRHQQGLLLIGLTRRSDKERPCLIVRSADGGATADKVVTFPGGLFVQALTESRLEPGCFYAYLDGELARGAGLYRSSDWGESWQRVPFALPEYIRTLPHRRQWIEGELLPVVVSQVKNVCGTNGLLRADPFEAGLVYFGEWTEGLYRVDGGGTWTDISAGLPFYRHDATVLVALEVDATRPGVLYAGFIREGFWRSEDRGESWQKIYPQDDTPFNASSVACGGPDGNWLVVACEPLYGSPCPSAVVLSWDRGKAWATLTDSTLGAIRWKGVTLDLQGNIHACSCGNGCFAFLSS